MPSPIRILVVALPLFGTALGSRCKPSSSRRAPAVTAETATFETPDPSIPTLIVSESSETHDSATTGIDDSSVVETPSETETPYTTWISEDPTASSVVIDDEPSDSSISDQVPSEAATFTPGTTSDVASDDVTTDTVAETTSEDIATQTESEATITETASEGATTEAASEGVTTETESEATAIETTSEDTTLATITASDEITTETAVPEETTTDDDTSPSTTGPPPIIETFAGVGTVPSQPDITGLKFWYNPTVMGAPVYMVPPPSLASSYIAGNLHLEEGTNRLMTGAYYLFATSSAKIVYTTRNKNQISPTNGYISCTPPVRVGVPLQCMAENTSRSQFRVTGNFAAANRVLSLVAPDTVVGSELPMDFIPVVPE